MPYRSGFNFLADPWLASVSWPWTSKPAGSELSLTSVCLSVCPGLCHSLRSASFTQALPQVPASGGGRGESPVGQNQSRERRQQLAQGVARLRGELQQLDLQMGDSPEREVSLEAAQERIRDAQRRSLLLKAYAARLAKERQQLQGSVAQLRGRLEQLKDISRKAKVELTVGGKLPDLGFAGLEPEVLDMVGSHPPNHVQAALEHLALENTLQMQELTSRIDIPRDVEALKAVLELELRAVRLAGLRDGLRRGCQELEQEASARHAELQALQSKRQRILDFRHLVREKQQQVRALIKGTSYIKCQLHKDQAEVQAFVQRKLLGPEQDVTLESQRLHGGVEREVRQLGAIALPCLLHRSLPGSQQVPAHELSIHRLDRTGLAQHRAFLTVCQAAGFPLYKAPEHLLPHMAELKKELLALRAQLSYKSQALASLQQRQGTDVQVLLQALRDHDREQAGALGPRIQLVTEQCERRMERWPEVQATIDAWWEQPGQFSLPAEHRQGLTLQQWLERWTLALKTLQQHSWA
nr:LOW QUALITY PROTEIN: HAUS augmin-like complex subunit 5 [Caretta caretta]